MSFLGNLLEEVFLLKLDIQSGRCRTQEIKDLERQEGQRLPGNGKQRVRVTTVEQLDRQKQTREIQGEFLKDDGARGHPNVLAGKGCLAARPETWFDLGDRRSGRRRALSTCFPLTSTNYTHTHTLSKKNQNKIFKKTTLPLHRNVFKHTK